MRRLILFCALLVAASAGAQIIDIPDATFKSLLVTSGETYVMVATDGSGFIAVDANADGNIDQDEANEVRELYIDSQGITSLEGIQYFTNLEVLDVSGNYLMSLDVTLLDDLEQLYVNNNQLTSLLIEDLHHLEELDCSSNQLGALVFGEMEYLQSVDCSDNNLAVLDFSGCGNLDQLSCANNTITYINIKNGTAQSSSTTVNQWGGNSGLAYMCIDDEEAATVNALLAACGYGTSVVANSFCSFTPGGDYNTITGTLTFDVDGNGCSATDPSQKFMKVTTTLGAESCAVFTDVNGEYEFYTLAGNFTVVPQFEEDYFTATPSTGSVTFPVVDNSVQTADFCIAANGTVSNDIEIVMVPVIAPVPGQEAYYKMVYKNKGNQVLSGSVNCTWDYSKFQPIGVGDISPYANDIQVNGYIATYIWNYTNLQPFESREINFHMQVNQPTDAIPVNVGDTFVFDAQAALAGDVIAADNNVQLTQQVVATPGVASITCVEGETAPVTQIGEYLHYVVNFTNDGTQTANNVVVETDFDPAQFDVNSLQVLNSSHTATARLNGNTARFIMQAAALGGGGHGTILFKAKTRNNLTLGSSVNTVARVYYDYNAAATTNTATTEFAVMGTGNITVDASIALYPNPTSGVVNIKSDNVIKSVNLYDVQGRLLQTELLNHTEAAININQRASGIYFIKVFTNAGVKVEKVVKE
jgi:uncharacterized repeat protein (TIGR01451 family)